MSLIEVVLFMSLLVTVFWGTSSVMNESVRKSSINDHRWDAAEVAGQVIEELSFSTLAPGQLKPDTYHRYFTKDYRVVATKAESFYRVEWTVTENNPIQGVYGIKLAVYWSETGVDQAIHYETFR